MEIPEGARIVSNFEKCLKIPRRYRDQYLDTVQHLNTVKHVLTFFYTRVFKTTFFLNTGQFLNTGAHILDTHKHGIFFLEMEAKYQTYFRHG